MKKILSFALLFLFFVGLAFAQNNQNNQLEEAVKKMRANDIDGALTIANEVIEKNPTYVSAYSFRAELFGIKGKIANVVADLSKAIELRPKEGNFYKRRADYRQMLNDFQGALQDYDKALENGVEGARIFTSRANVKMILRDLDGALKDFEMAVNIRPHSVVANMGYSRILSQKGEKQKAIEHLDNFLQKTETEWNNRFPALPTKTIGENKTTVSPPDNWNENKVFRGTQTIISKDEPKSRAEGEAQAEYMEQILNLPAAYSTLAQFYIETDNIPKAEENIKKAFALDDKGDRFFDIRAKIRYKKGDYSGAIEDLNRAIGRLVYPTLYLERGLAYLMLGKDKEAQADFDKYLEMFPKGKTFLDKRLEETKKIKEIKQ